MVVVVLVTWLALFAVANGSLSSLRMSVRGVSHNIPSSLPPYDAYLRTSMQPTHRPPRTFLLLAARDSVDFIYGGSCINAVTKLHYLTGVIPH